MMEAIKAEDLCNKFLRLKTTTQGDFQKISIDTFGQQSQPQLAQLGLMSSKPKSMRVRGPTQAKHKQKRYV